ncbi:MAG: DUF3280 domain-containing protein [Methylomonas sp.]|uniref:DUF2380 domain-containing protein n=1 Tax=Methylomonas sp. TaxID=418 RepID=UPI0025EBC63B|nr:DUF2380 domain-containing protein [Methylomonas sp.]MCK9607631.1 DUF3280 domain-containing protein [Methylomonas sp.]
MRVRLIMGLLFALASLDSPAATRIAILAFELKDLTLAPGIPAEIKRTGAIRPLLAGELASAGYTIVDIPLAAQQSAAGGVGDLFDHADAAAELGKQFGADYVLVGRLHKPSFLFAYLMGHLVRVENRTLIGNLIIESKGPNAQLVRKAVESLADKIDALLDNRYDPPPPSKLKTHQHPAVLN